MIHLLTIDWFDAFNNDTKETKFLTQYVHLTVYCYCTQYRYFIYKVTLVAVVVYQITSVDRIQHCLLYIAYLYNKHLYLRHYTIPSETMI